MSHNWFRLVGKDEGVALGYFVAAPSGRRHAQRNIKTYGSGWCGGRDECATRYPNRRAVGPAAKFAYRVRESAMGQDAETNTERQAVFAVARGDSVAPTALRRRQSGAGFPRRTLNWEEGGDFQWIGRALASFRAGGHNADGSTEAVFACAVAESGPPGFGVWARSRGRAVAIRGRSDLLSGEVSASNSDWRSESQQLRITPSSILPITFSSSKDETVTSEPERIRWLDMHKLGSEL